MNLETIYFKSPELKKRLIERSFQFGIPLELVCKDIGIDYEYFLKEYLNKKYVEKVDISIKKFESLLDKFGIYPKLQFILDDNFEMKANEIKEYLRIKFPKKHETGREANAQSIKGDDNFLD